MRKSKAREIIRSNFQEREHLRVSNITLRAIKQTTTRIGIAAGIHSGSALTWNLSSYKFIMGEF